MRSGLLRERVRIEQFTAAADSYGQPLETWAELATVWGEVRPAASREGFAPGAGQVLAVATHRVRMRYRSDVDEMMRLVWRGRTLQVEAVQDPGGRRAEMFLLCREIRVAAEAGTPAAVYLFDFSDPDMSMYLGAV